MEGSRELGCWPSDLLPEQSLGLCRGPVKATDQFEGMRSRPGGFLSRRACSEPASSRSPLGAWSRAHELGALSEA